LQGPTLPFLGSADEFFGHTAYGLGTVFKITPSGTLTVLHTFIGSDGAHPVATLAQ
jgi:uncharacterized repeat protein (TIGR03803 family)